MGLALQNSPPGIIPMSQMKDGDVAVVTGGSAYDGQIVQRIIREKWDVAQVIGGKDGMSWTDPSPCSLMVRILQPGETLVVT